MAELEPASRPADEPAGMGLGGAGVRFRGERPIDAGRVRRRPGRAVQGETGSAIPTDVGLADGPQSNEAEGNGYEPEAPPRTTGEW
jgi:hypothetical protein